MLFTTLLIVVSFIATTVSADCPLIGDEPGIKKDVKDYFVAPDFTADVELFEEENLKVKAIKVSYAMGGPDKVIRLTVTDQKITQDLYYVFADNEILQIKYPANIALGVCKVINNLDTNPMSILVGGKATAQGDNGNFLSFFHMSGKDAKGKDIKVSFLGTDVVRGKTAEKYVSCQAWQLQDGTVFDAVVTVYFSIPDWIYPKKQRVPIQMEVTGTANQKHIHHFFSIFNFKYRVGDLATQTPPGVYCEGRNNHKAFPQIPTLFKWKQEKIDRFERTLSYSEQTFDSINKVTVQRVQKKSNSLTGMNQLVIVSNYMSGLEFEIDQDRWLCKIRNITSNPKIPYFKYGSNGEAVLEKATSVFMEDQTTYTYMGPRFIRRMMAEVWAGKIETKEGNKAVVEWYFAANNTKSANDGGPMSSKKYYQIPLMNRIWTMPVDNGGPDQNDLPFYRQAIFQDYATDLNIHDFDYSEVMWSGLSMWPCLNKDFRDGAILFKDQGDTLNELNQELFKWKFMQSASKAAKVHWLRISHVYPDYQDNNDIIVWFTILDKTPHASDVKTPYPNASPQEAFDSISKVVKDGSFYVSFTEDGDEEVQMFADKQFPYQPHFYREPIVNNDKLKGDDGESGYSDGSMAGLGIAMLIIGLAGGGGVSVAMVKKGIYS